MSGPWDYGADDAEPAGSSGPQQLIPIPTDGAGIECHLGSLYMKYMNTELRRLRAMSRSQFYGYFVLVGGLAGLLAWVLVLWGSFQLGMVKPTGFSLLLAIPRGSLFAVVLGLLLRWHWNRRR